MQDVATKEDLRIFLSHFHTLSDQDQQDILDELKRDPELLRKLLNIVHAKREAFDKDENELWQYVAELEKKFFE